VNEQLLLGSPVIDLQHQGLFMSFRKLASANEAEFPAVVISDVLSDLTRQIFEHFSTEEAFMLELGLPDDMYQAHRAAHVSILEEVAQIHLDAMYGKNQALAEVIATVSTWVQRHLVEFDLALKPYILIQPNSSS
jgi:hemerythrin-like metal-binding protein